MHLHRCCTRRLREHAPDSRILRQKLREQAHDSRILEQKREPDIGSYFSFQVSTQTVFILMISPDFLYIRNLL